MFQNVSERTTNVKMYQNMSDCVGICQDVSEHITVCQNTSEYFRICRLGLIPLCFFPKQMRRCSLCWELTQFSSYKVTLVDIAGYDRQSFREKNVN